MAKKTTVGSPISDKLKSFFSKEKQEIEQPAVEYIRDLRVLVHEHRLVGLLKGRRDILGNPKLLHEYEKDLEFYEKKYEHELKKAEDKQRAWDRLDPVKKYQIKKNNEIKAKFDNRDFDIRKITRDEDERIREIERNYTRPNFSGYFPEEDLSHNLSKNSFAIFDTETDDKGRILTINATKVRYDYTDNKLVRVSSADADWGRVYNPKDISVNETESVHHLNPRLLAAMRTKSGADYSEQWDKSQLKDFKEWLGGSVLVGHNIEDADIPWLYNKGKDSQWRGYKKSFIDTVHLARGLWKGQKNDLEALSERLGVSFSSISGLQHHDVFSDVVVTAKVFEEIAKRFGMVRNALDLDKFQTIHYDRRRVLNGASGFFAKPGGGYIMEEDIDNMTPEEIQELMDAREEADIKVDYDADGNNTGYGYTNEAVKDYINNRIHGIYEQAGSVYRDRVNDEYRFVNEAAKYFKLGKSYDEVLKLMDGAYHLTGSVSRFLDRAQALAGNRPVATLRSSNDWDIIDKANELNRQKNDSSKQRNLDAFMRRRDRGIQYSGVDLASKNAQIENAWRQSKIDSRAQARLDKINRIAEKKELADSYRITRENRIGYRDENAWKARRDAFYQNRRNKNLEKLSAAEGKLTVSDRMTLTSMLDTNTAKFAETVERLSRNIKTADTNTEAWAENVTKFAQNAKVASVYDPTRVYDAKIQGNKEIYGAVSHLIPQPFRNSYNRAASAWTELATAQQAINKNTYRNASNIVNMVGTGIGSTFGVVGTFIGNAAASLATNLIFGKMEAETTKNSNIFAAKINMLSAGIQTLLVPLRLFHNGLNMSLKLFSRLGNLVSKQYGMPLTDLTGITAPVYSTMLDADIFFGLKQGTTNSMHNQLAYDAADLYTSGRYDQKKLVAAARLGLFSQVYAPMGANTKESMITIVDKLQNDLRNADEATKQQILTLTKDIDPNLPNILKRLDSYGLIGKSMSYRDYITGDAFRGTVRQWNMNPREEAKWHYAAGEFSSAMHQTEMAFKRAALPVWDRVALPVMNIFNGALNKFATSDKPTGERIKNLITDVYKEVKVVFSKEGWNEILSPIKTAWKDLLGDSTVAALERGFKWLEQNVSRLNSFLEPIFESFYDFMASIDVEGNIFTGFHVVNPVREAVNSKFKIKDADTVQPYTHEYAGVTFTARNEQIWREVKKHGQSLSSRPNLYKMYLEGVAKLHPEFGIEVGDINPNAYSRSKEQAEAALNDVKAVEDTTFDAAKFALKRFFGIDLDAKNVADNSVEKITADKEVEKITSETADKVIASQVPTLYSIMQGAPIRYDKQQAANINVTISSAKDVEMATAAENITQVSNSKHYVNYQWGGQ